MDIEVDFTSAESWDRDMTARLAWLRENDPVHWSEASGLWLLTKYADVIAVSKQPAIFCSGQGVRPGIPVRQSLIDEDAPRHTRLRNLINRGFTPRRVSLLEPSFRDIVTEAIDAVAARGACDFVDDIAVPLPLLLIADMIGIRREDRASFHEWSDAMMAGDGNYDKPDVMKAATEAFVAYSTYVTGIIEDRRKHPQSDLVSILVGAKDEGILADFDGESDRHREAGDEVQTELQNDELIMLLVLLLAAGNETTRNAISGGMELLIRHPDVRRRLIDDPSLIPAAVEEMLRLVTPVQSFARTATRDVVLGGKKILEGQKVLMLYPSANRDEAVFPDPDVFDIDRRPNHLAFGIGSHFCLGANLARMEMRVAFAELLRRLPDMELAGDGPVLRPNALVRSVVSMPVRFTPQAG